MTLRLYASDDVRNLAENALALADFGFRMFPLRAYTKDHPAVRDWPHRATTDHAAIELWWYMRPQSNIAIATGVGSGCFVVDVDPRHGGDETLERLERRNGRLPETVSQRTPRGGVHFFFHCDDDSIRNSCHLVGHGIDVRGHHGYVAAAPSIVELDDGGLRRYRWLLGPDEIEIAVAPDWLLEAMVTPEPEATVSRGGTVANHNVDALIHTLLRATEGQRNCLAYWVACRLGEAVRDGGISEGEAVAIVIEAAMRTGLTQREAKATARSGVRKGRGG